MMRPMPSVRRPSNWAVLFSYVLPYFAYVLVLSLPESAVPKPVAYALAMAASAAGLAWGWRWYLPLRGPGSPLVSVIAGAAAGIVGTALWVAIKGLLYESGGEAWAPAAFWGRLVASSTVVPVFEELLFRGLLLLGAVQWDEARRAGSKDPIGDALHDRSVLEVAPGAWTPAALAVSTLAFAAGHAPGEWPAAIAYGLLMAGLWIARKDLLSCVVAHGVTNLTLALWVRETSNWTLW
jgi:membrane protease YdiL (CAAX protease family)